MADRDVDILLVGGGIASATAAATLRDEGFEGTVLLVSRELDQPYHRPPVSKGYLQGLESRSDALVHPEGWWERSSVELATRTSVLGLDPAARTATLSTRTEVGFGQALVATGATVRRLAVDGASWRASTTCARSGRPTRCAPTSRRSTRRLRRRLVHRLGGRGVADRARQARHGRSCRRRTRSSAASAGSPGSGSAELLEEHGIAVVGRDGSRASRATGSASRAWSPPAGGRCRRTPSYAGSARCPTSCSRARPASSSARSAGSAATRACARAPRRLCRGRPLRVRQRPARAAVRIEHEDVAARQGADRGAQPPRCGRSARGRALLLLRPRRLGRARVRRAGARLGRGARPRLARGRALRGLVPARGPRRRVLSVNGGGDLDHARDLVRSGAPLEER